MKSTADKSIKSTQKSRKELHSEHKNQVNGRVRSGDKTVGFKDVLELLVQRFNRADVLARQTTELFETCLSVFLRLVILQYAKPGTISSLRNSMQNEEAVWERRFDAWPRLREISRRLFANSVLFSPDRFPVLAIPDILDDQTILYLLNKVALFVSESEPLEQIGYIYESLLDYEIRLVDERDRSDAWNRYFVTACSNRRSTGTHYTPVSLAGEIVLKTLAPFLYGGVDYAKRRNIKSPHEILSLKICDPAMGSGVFLLQACRWMANRLVESWDAEEFNGKRISTDGISLANSNKTQSIPTDPEARFKTALKLVAERCLYGVDINPIAVEIAKLSLRLLADADIVVLGEHLRNGDSLGGESSCSFDWNEQFPHVFQSDSPGFDAVIGNPPFMGGRKMRNVFGDSYLRHLKTNWPHASLNADLCSFFLLRASDILHKNGAVGFLATNTIAQGDTAKTGLLHLVQKKGFQLREAVPSFSWPGEATVVATWIILQRGQWNGKRYLNGRPVATISPILDEGRDWGNAVVLPENKAINFQGSVLAGTGFLLSRDEAEKYLLERECNREVIFSFLGGNDVNSNPTFSTRRFAIDFRDNSLAYCEQRWPELLERIRLLVKPQRDKAVRSAHRRYWWMHGDKRPALYSRIRNQENVFVLARHTKHLAIASVSSRQIFQESLCVLDLPNWTAFAAIQSTLHEIWARRGSSTLGNGLRYTPSDYFDTFPFLHLRSEELEKIGKSYYEFRQMILSETGKGLTDAYNRFHSPKESDERIERLRKLHRRMDEIVAATYGWSDLTFDHDFRKLDNCSPNDRIRWTFDEKTKDEILRRFGELNRQLCKRTE